MQQRRLRRLLASAGLALGLATAWAGDPSWPLSGELTVHDPTLWPAHQHAQGSLGHPGDWVFATGAGLTRLHSHDGRHWTRQPPVFTAATRPAWWTEAVPDQALRGQGSEQGLDVWAPKAFAHRGRLWLAYSISSFGQQRSAIGLASVDLADGPGAPAERWRDEGQLLASQPGDATNAIDPELFRDSDGSLWLAWGSWWQGLRLVRLDEQSLRPQGEVHALARRRGGIEAPTLLRHGDWVYLFMSWGQCCKGVDSSYEMRVGRSRAVTGPFVDRAGLSLLAGGGTPLLAARPGASAPGRWKGPGHQDVVVTPDGEHIVWHAYDAEAGGRPTLRRARLRWTDDGWPAL